MLYLLLSVLVLFFVVVATIVLLEFLKYQRNPVSLMTNHDKRFEKIKSIYLHKFGVIEREIVDEKSKL